VAILAIAFKARGREARHRHAVAKDFVLACENPARGAMTRSSRRGHSIVLKSIKFIGIAVRDQDQALAFWTKKIGFQVATDQPMGNAQRWIELKIPGAQTGLALYTPQGQEGRIGTFHNMSFVVDDVEKAYRQLSERGVEFAQPPKKETWGTSAIFKDADGNTFVIGTS
jgi:predicted enzyme related to lactoylglutathione lyase